jgi:hypothetical protein
MKSDELMDISPYVLNWRDLVAEERPWWPVCAVLII